jgi:hypothetical protein
VSPLQADLIPSMTQGRCACQSAPAARARRASVSGESVQQRCLPGDDRLWSAHGRCLGGSRVQTTWRMRTGVPCHW